MANSSTSFLLAFYLFTAFLIISSWTVDAGGEQRLSWVPPRARCQGSVDECMADEEFDMDSGVNRRNLATSQYISYGALQRNTVPCSRKGASYYNCKPGALSNPYIHGCSAIARCRS